MQIYHTMTPVSGEKGCAVALGYFDGVHCGHRMVLGSAVRYAAENGLAPAAFTFELPGNQTLKGGRILSAAQKHLRMESLGIDERGSKAVDLVVDASGAEVCIQMGLFLVKYGGTYLQVCSNSIDPIRHSHNARCRAGWHGLPGSQHPDFAFPG